MSHRGEHAGRKRRPALLHTQMERRQRRENQRLVPQTVCLHAVLPSALCSNLVFLAVHIQNKDLIFLHEYKDFRQIVIAAQRAEEIHPKFGES